MFFILLIVAQLQQPNLNGIILTNDVDASRSIVKVETLQNTYSPQSTATGQYLQPTAKTEELQSTYNPQ